MICPFSPWLQTHPSHHHNTSPLVLHVFSSSCLSSPHIHSSRSRFRALGTQILTSQLHPRCAARPRWLLWTRLPRSSALPCLEESRAVTHGPWPILCCAAPSFHQHLPWGCGRAGLEAGFTHSFSHRYTLSISVLGGADERDSSPTLCPDFGGNKCQFYTGLWRCWWFLLQHKQLKDLPPFSSEILLQGGEKYNALLWDTSVMEEHGHIHLYGFKWTGHLEHYTLCRSQKFEILSDQSAELLQPCAESQPKAKELYFRDKVGMKIISTPLKIISTELSSVLWEFYPEQELLKPLRWFVYENPQKP